jgi:beta-mannosidase
MEFSNPEGQMGHDVHGPWKYLGNPKHYEFFAHCNHLLHSEFGADGMSAEVTLKDTLSPLHQAPKSMTSDVVWRFHGEWWDTQDRDQLMFGDVETLTDRIDCSQWIQAEAIRFAIESNRRHKFHNSGAIVWQLNEPWPNVSNTCLMDYFGRKKMAYYWTRNAFANIVTTLDYRRLDHLVGSAFSGEIYVIADQPVRHVTVKAAVRNLEGQYLDTVQYDVTADLHHAKWVGRLDFPVTIAMKELFFVQLTTTNDTDTPVPSNLYLFSTTSDRPYGLAPRLAEDVRLVVKPLGDWMWTNGTQTECGRQYHRRYAVENRGTVVALHVRAEETTANFWVESDQNFFSLFPGESTIVTIECFPRDYSGLLRPYRQETDHPKIIFRPFCGPMAVNDREE